MVPGLYGESGRVVVLGQGRHGHRKAACRWVREIWKPTRGRDLKKGRGWSGKASWQRGIEKALKGRWDVNNLGRKEG